MEAPLCAGHSQGDQGHVPVPTVPAARPRAPRTFHTGLVRGDGGTLDSHAVLLGGQRRVDGDLIIGLVTVWEPQVKILELDVHIGQDELETDGRGLASAQMTVTQGHVGTVAGDTPSGQGRGKASGGLAKAGKRPGLWREAGRPGCSPSEGSSPSMDHTPPAVAHQFSQTPTPSASRVLYTAGSLFFPTQKW